MPCGPACRARSGARGRNLVLLRPRGTVPSAHESGSLDDLVKLAPGPPSPIINGILDGDQEEAAESTSGTSSANKSWVHVPDEEGLWPARRPESDRGRREVFWRQREDLALEAKADKAMIQEEADKIKAEDFWDRTIMPMRDKFNQTQDSLKFARVFLCAF